MNIEDMKPISMAMKITSDALAMAVYYQKKNERLKEQYDEVYRKYIDLHREKQSGRGWATDGLDNG